MVGTLVGSNTHAATLLDNEEYKDNLILDLADKCSSTLSRRFDQKSQQIMLCPQSNPTNCYLSLVALTKELFVLYTPPTLLRYEFKSKKSTLIPF